MRIRSWVLQIVSLLVVFVTAAGAQETPKPSSLPDAPVPKQENAQERHENPIDTTIGILDRRSVFFPELAVDRGPLKTRQKFELFVDESIAPSRLVGSALGAGIGQARDSLSGYGEGWGGYSKRFGSSMASAASSNFFGTFLISSMVHNDPRYFVRFQGRFGQRVGYALSRIVVARTDSGGSAPNWGGIIGPLLAEGLANSYLPSKEQTTGKTFARYGWRIGLNAASNALREYWPTIFRSLRITKIAPGLGNETGPTPPTTRPVP
jgi:hypothetical protein